MIDKMDLSNKASMVRKDLGEDNSSPIDIFALVHALDKITILLYPLGSKISGACFKSEVSAVIAINSAMSLGRQRFTLAHELYHLHFDDRMSSSICTNNIGSGNEVEKAADRFASYLLMPQTALYESIQKIKDGTQKKLTIEDVVALEQHFGVSRKAILFRLQEENELLTSDVGEMQVDVIRTAARLGFDTSLYKKLPENKQRGTYGYYIKQAENLLQSGVISNGKYEEWLLDAFRDDIVFGEEMEGGELID